MNWDTFDFVIFGAMLLAASVAFFISGKLAKTKKQRTIAVFTIVLVFFLAWLELAVGIFGEG